MAEHSNRAELGRKLFPRAGTQLRPRPAPPSRCIEASSTSNMNSSMCSSSDGGELDKVYPYLDTSNISININDDDAASVCSSTSSTSHRSSSSSNNCYNSSGSSNSSSSNSNSTSSSAVHGGIQHDGIAGNGMDHTIGGGGSGGGSGDGESSSIANNMIVASSPSSSSSSSSSRADTSNIGDIVDNTESSRSRWSSSSPVASGIQEEKEALAVSDLEQTLSFGGGGDGDGGHAEHVGQGRGIAPPPSSPLLPSSSLLSTGSPMESDRNGSEGGEEEEEEGVDTAADKIFVLVEQGQEARERILHGVAEKGDIIQQVGRQMAQDARKALASAQHEKDQATSELKMSLALLTQKIEETEEERDSCLEIQRTLRGTLDVERRDHAQTVERLTVCNAEVREQLQRAEGRNLQLIKQYDSLSADKAVGDEKNRSLQAEVVSLREQLAAMSITVGNSAPAESGGVKAATCAISEVHASTRAPVGVSVVGSAVSATKASPPLPAVAATKDIVSTSVPSDLVTKGKATPSPPAAIAGAMGKVPFSPRLAAFAKRMATTPSRSTATVVAKGKASLSPVAAATPAKSTATHSPPAAAAITEGKGTPPAPAVLPAKSKATHSTPAAAITEGKAAPPSTPAATLARGKVVSSAVATMPSHAKLTPAEACKQITADDENPSKDDVSPPAATPTKGKAVDGTTPRQFTRRPLGAISLNSGGKRAEVGQVPSLAARLVVSKPAEKRSSLMAEGVPPITARVVTTTAVKKRTSLAARPTTTNPAVKRSSLMVQEVPSTTGRVASGTTVEKRNSVGKGSNVKVGWGGAPTSRAVKAHGSGGDAGGKVGAASSGRVLRSATRAAAAAAAKKKKEVGIEGAAGGVPVGDASSAPPARSTRSATRRPTQKTASTTGRGVSSRGKFMSF